MSRIEELEICLRLANERAATLSAANDKLSRQLEAECGTEQKLHDKIRHLTAQLTAKDQERKDLAMLVRRLCYAMSKTGTHAKLQEQALDYLNRKGLQGDILRGGDDGAKH